MQTSALKEQKKHIETVMSYDVMVLLGEFPLHSADILLGDKVVSYLLL